MDLGITKVSDKGQIVIPKEVRDSMGLVEGIKLLVISDGDSIILQKVQLVGDKWKIKDLIIKTKEMVNKLGLKI
jgi:AbrB family looped-hinge helix DNA binding protein